MRLLLSSNGSKTRSRYRNLELEILYDILSKNVHPTLTSWEIIVSHLALPISLAVVSLSRGQEALMLSDSVIRCCSGRFFIWSCLLREETEIDQSTIDH